MEDNEEKFFEIFIKEFCDLHKIYIDNQSLPSIGKFIYNPVGFKEWLMQGGFIVLASSRGQKILTRFVKISDEFRDLHKQCIGNGMKSGVYFLIDSWTRVKDTKELKKWLRDSGFSALATKIGIRFLSGFS